MSETMESNCNSRVLEKKINTTDHQCMDIRVLNGVVLFNAILRALF